MNPKMILRELLNLTDMTTAQALRIHKLIEILMIGENKNLILVSFQMVAPSVKGLNNSQ